jgi:hypothetical protein
MLEVHGMSILLTVILVLIILNLAGGAVPTYRTGRYYGPSWGAIVLIVLILYLMGYR